MTKTVKLRHIETNCIHEIPIDQILEMINSDRSSNWIDYNQDDWLEGWLEWCWHDQETWSLLYENGEPLSEYSSSEKSKIAIALLDELDGIEFDDNGFTVFKFYKFPIGATRDEIVQWLINDFGLC